MTLAKLAGFVIAATLPLSLAFATPASAQATGGQMDHPADHKAMGHDAGMAGHDMSGHKMSDADMTKMKSCNMMSHADAAKDAKCAALMKAHPDMMHHMPSADAKKTM